MAELGYQVEYVKSLNDADGYDVIVLVGETLEEHVYPDFLKPFISVIKENGQV